MRNFVAKKLLVQIFEKGQIVYDSPNVHEIKKYCAEQVDSLWDEVKRFEKPHRYIVDLSHDLWSIKDKLLKKHR